MMKTRTIAAAAFLLTACCLGAQSQVGVSNSRELARAITSNRTVLLAPGEYLVSEVAQVANPAVSWNQTFDGAELVITGVSNLALRAERGAALLASSRYAFVLVFVNCRNLVLEGLTLGHTEAGECVGGVLRFEACAGVRVEGCDLFGSGVVGIQADDCSRITIRASTIRDCSQGALWADHVQDLRAEDVLISGNESWPLLSLNSSRGVVFEACRIENNSGAGILYVDGDAEQVSLARTEITGNATESLFYEGSLVPDLSGVILTGNTFGDELQDEEGEYQGEYEEGYEEEYYPEDESGPDAG